MREKTPWAVVCSNDGRVYLSIDEYDEQMSNPNAKWQCPKCHRTSEWDDDNYENYINELEKKNETK